MPEVLYFIGFLFKLEVMSLTFLSDCENLVFLNLHYRHELLGGRSLCKEEGN